MIVFVEIAGFSARKPSIADVTLIAGVMNPSDISVAQPIIAGKITQLALLPQGKPEREERVLKMIAQMDKEGFGNCTNTYACEAECPKGISVSVIAKMNREFLRAGIRTEE